MADLSASVPKWSSISGNFFSHLTSVPLKTLAKFAALITWKSREVLEGVARSIIGMIECVRECFSTADNSYRIVWKLDSNKSRIMEFARHGWWSSSAKSFNKRIPWPKVICLPKHETIWREQVGMEERANYIMFGGVFWIPRFCYCLGLLDFGSLKTLKVTPQRLCAETHSSGFLTISASIFGPQLSGRDEPVFFGIGPWEIFLSSRT